MSIISSKKFNIRVELIIYHDSKYMEYRANIGFLFN